MNRLNYILFLSIIFQVISNGIFISVGLCTPPPPKIFGWQSNIKICNNSQGNLSVYLSPGGYTLPVTYKWYINKNDGNGWVPLSDGGIYAGTDKYDLKIGRISAGYPVVYAMNGYQYRCEVTDATGTLITDAATITIPKPGLITKDLPSDSALICEGKDLCFNMDGICTGGETPVFQWFQTLGTGGYQLLLDDGSMGPFYTGAKSKTLCINNVIKADPPAGVFQYYKGGLACGGCYTNTRAVQLYISKGVFVTKQPVDTIICEGTAANFKVSATGELLKYQWQVNPKTGTFGNVTNTGIYSGANSPILNLSSVSTAMNGYEYKCIVSNDSCGNSASLKATLSVTPLTVASVSISPLSASICPGASQNFTATPVNGGSPPLYRWKRNGTIITGATNSTYGNNNFNNGDKITCEMTSTMSGCVTPGYIASNVCTVTVAANSTAAVTITTTNNNICSGASVCFSATPTLPGASPKYQWKRNGVNISGATDLVYCTSALTGSSNSITVELTSNDPCVSPKIVQSNGINVTVTANAPVSVSISNPAIICSSGMTSFTATPVNGGAQPLYTWKRGGTIIVSGSTSSIVDIPDPVQGENITVEVTSSAGGCVTNNPATASKTLTVTPSLSASVTISSAPNPVCSGGTVVFSATPVNGGTGTFPKYQWMSKGTPISGATKQTYSGLFTSGDTISCVMTSNATPCLINSTDTSNIINVVVLPNVTAQVSISASQTVICANDMVDFTAAPQYPGSNPVYKWYVKGVQDVGASNSPYYSKSGLNNNDDVQCVMTSDENCVSGSPASSNKIIITVTTPVAASVSITSSNPSVCTGTSICFTAASVNGGTTPTYRWLDGNGTPIIGETDSTFCSANLVTGDNISCEITSSLSCVSKSVDTSNQVAVTITPGSVASITISATDTTICPNTNVDFTAVYQNGGASPSLQWQLNGTDIPGASSASLSKSDLMDNDTISCILISNAQCVTGSPDTSDIIVIKVLSNVTASISISQPPASICSGTNVNFTATPIYGGTKPKYQWQLNGSDISGETNATFSSNSLSNNDKISCVLISNEQCVIGSPDTSVQIPVTIIQSVAPAVTISTATTFPVCGGTQVCFTATPSGEGTNPTYTWMIDGTNQPGSNSVSFCKSDLQKGQKVSVKMTSNAQCASPLTVNSNDITADVDSTLSVSVTVSTPLDSICAGTNASFTAIPVNPGNTPIYKWLVNGSPAPGGSNSDVYSSTVLNTGDVVAVELTSAIQCVSGSPAIDSVTVTVMNTVDASVTITGTPNPVCTGGTVSFTATPVNGGTKPTYQWRINSNDISGATSFIFSPNNISNNDVVDVLMTSDLLCVSNSPAKSDSIIINVLPINTVSVTISSTGNNICAGAQVCFTATPVNEGNSPVYQWKVGSANAPGSTNSKTYCTASLADNEVVTLVLTSDIDCPNPGNGVAISNADTMNVVTSVTPSVTITSSPAVICPNTIVNYTATSINGGTTSYQWFLNNNPVGSNTDIYSNPVPQTNDSVWVVITSTEPCATQPTATSNKIKINITTGVNASVTISPSAVSVCDGSSVSFTANETNGGTPTYQWFIDGSLISDVSDIISKTLSQGTHSVSLIMTSSAGCVLNSPVTSDTITVTVNPINNVSVSITGSPTDICEGDNVTFSAVPVNPGNNPVYQWYINQTKAGKGGNTFDTTGLQSTDVVKVELTSDAVCPNPVPAVSIPVSVNVTKYVTAGVTISTASPTICNGESATFTAVPDNGGNPTYNWLVNGSPLSPPVTGAVFNNSSLADKDVVTCVMTSSLKCVNGSPATSDSIEMSVNQSVVASISITNSTNDVCDGTNIDFTATPVNEGTTPAYQWQINGVDVTGENNLTFSSTKLKNGDIVTCKLTSSIKCVNGSPAVSNGVTMIINPVTIASVTIVSSSVVICPGASADFTATPSNEGQAPTYQWKLDGVDIPGETNLTYSTATPKDGSVISCEMTSDKLCVTGSPATSNVMTIRINQSIVPSIIISASQTDICATTNVDFTSVIKNGGQNPKYQWKINGADVNGATGLTFSSNNLSNDDIVTCLLLSDAYCATVQDTISNSVLMSVHAIPVLTITTDVKNSCNGTPVQLEVSGADSYVWTPDKYLSCTTCPTPVSNPLKTITYTVKGTIDICSATDSIILEVFCEDIFVPTAFTPNGDLNNDVFMMQGPLIYNYNMKIFSRWGELVFESNDQTIGWDGRYHNADAPPGVYVWTITGEDYFGNKVTRNGRKGIIAGDVTLFR